MFNPNLKSYWNRNFINMTIIYFKQKYINHKTWCEFLII